MIETLTERSEHEVHDYAEALAHLAARLDAAEAEAATLDRLIAELAAAQARLLALERDLAAFQTTARAAGDARLVRELGPALDLRGAVEDAIAWDLRERAVLTRRSLPAGHSGLVGPVVTGFRAFRSHLLQLARLHGPKP